MRHNMPYKLKPIDHTSASGIRDAISCEAKHGLGRNCIGVPVFPQPVAAVYGIVFHFFAQLFGEKFWKRSSLLGKLPLNEGKELHKQARGFLLRVLAEKQGPRGYDDRDPVQIRWFYPRQQMMMSEEEYYDKIKETTGQMVGRLYNALEAYRLQFTLPNRFMDMKFELPFKGRLLRMPLPGSNGFLQVKLDGFIDWLRIFPIYQFEVCDFKTGWVVNEYRKRINVVDDVQMTIYDYVCRQIFEAPPVAMYIQPMDFSSAFLHEHGPLAMEKSQIYVDPSPRTETHFEELRLLARDVYEMSNMVAQAHLYTQNQISEWEPLSSYGKKTGFEQNVRELRYIPRIGPACDTCRFIGLCQDINKADWTAYARKHKSQESEPVMDPFLIEPRKPMESNQLQLVADMVPKRTKYVKKSDKQVKNEMLATKQFVPIKTLQKTKDRPTVTGMVPFFNKLVQLMREHGDCPCLKQKLFPIHIAPYLRELYFSRISLTEVLAKCPCEDCPRRTNSKQAVS